MEFSMVGLKSVREIITDKIAMIETNYERDEDWEKGWKVEFKRENLDEKIISYKDFIAQRFEPFADVVIKRLKELNPNINVVKEDKRKRYR